MSTATGVAHVASHAVDSRYRLVLGDAPGGNGAEPVPGKTDAPSGCCCGWRSPPRSRPAPVLREAAEAHGVDEPNCCKAVIAVESASMPRRVAARRRRADADHRRHGDRYATPAELKQPAGDSGCSTRAPTCTPARACWPTCCAATAASTWHWRPGTPARRRCAAMAARCRRSTRRAPTCNSGSGAVLGPAAGPHGQQGAHAGRAMKARPGR
jgi:hypothetical protein